MTIEQIEAEGWTRVAVDAEYYVAATNQVDSRWAELGYDIPKQRLQVLKAYQHPSGQKTRETIFYGRCPNIETFKYLLNLLDV